MSKSPDSGSDYGESYDILIWSLIGIILLVLIGICVTFGINDKYLTRIEIPWKNEILSQKNRERFSDSVWL